MPQVGIIMGSDSDLPTMKAAAQVLQEFGVPCEVSVVSAHRTPERMTEYARGAHARGIKVIIAGAGGWRRGMAARRAGRAHRGAEGGACLARQHAGSGSPGVRHAALAGRGTPHPSTASSTSPPPGLQAARRTCRAWWPP
jgi:hypothetical protein